MVCLLRCFFLEKREKVQPTDVFFVYKLVYYGSTVYRVARSPRRFRISFSFIFRRIKSDFDDCELYIYILL